MKKNIDELFRSSFAKGILCGVVFAVIFFLSWKVFIIAGGIWLLYYIAKCKF
ncbi:MAG: hypothetical protein WAX04_01305 [Oscillospiraceae bacterium]